MNFLPGTSSLIQLVFGIICFLLVGQSVNAATRTSTGSGNWNTAARWTPAGVPAAGDVVIIASGHTIVLNTNTPVLASLSISGTLTLGDNNTNRTITISGNITVNSGGTFNSAGNGDNVVTVGGNIINNGTFDMNIGSADAFLVFNGSANQTVSGTGGVTDIFEITINNSGAANNNIVEVTSSNFTVAADFLTLTDGILKLSGSYTLTNDFFSTSSPVINADEGIWLNNPNVTVNGVGGDTRLYGLIRITSGKYEIGTGANHCLEYYTGSRVIVEGGTLEITGAFCGAGTSETVTYSQSGGTITVNTIGNSNSVGSFDIRSTASSFSMSGGKIVMERAATGYTDYVNNANTSTVTGGTIQAGGLLTLSSEEFWVSSTPAIYDLKVESLNDPLFQLRNNTQVINDVIIGGILDAATQDVNLSVGGDWVNNGVFLQSNTAPVTFNGSSAQNISGLIQTTFKNVVFNNTGGGVTINTPVSVSIAATFTAGLVNSTATNSLTFLNNSTTTGGNNNASNPSYVNGPVRKVGNDAFTFPVGKSGSGYHPCSISAPFLSIEIFSAEYMRASANSIGSVTAPGVYQISNCDYWNIGRPLGISSVNITLSWNGTSNCNAATYVTNLSSLTVVQFNGTSWNTQSVSATSGTVSSGTITRNSISSFNSFALGSTSAAGNVLPVSLSSVKAFAVASNNRVEWINETEEQVQRYVVERSVDGNAFNISAVQLPAFNSGGKASYMVLDPVSQEKTYWYRIKVIEANGKETISPIVKVSRAQNASAKLLVYPNPATAKEITMEISGPTKEIYQVAVITQAGEIIYRYAVQKQSGNFSFSVRLPQNISPGYYAIRATGATHSLGTMLLVQ